MAVVPFRRRNTLAYPAGLVAGFDPSHLAAGNTQLSIVPFAGGNFINCVNGIPGTLSGALNAAITAFGPGVTFANGSANISFLQGMAVGTSLVYGTVVNFTSSNGDYQSIIQHETAGGLDLLCRLPSGNFGLYANGNVDSTIPAALNTPYFVAVSLNASACITVVRNLATGQIFSSSVAGAAPSTDSGTYRIGNNSGTQGTNGNILAAMYAASSYLSMAQLCEWAEDPWSFWYPPQQRSRVAAPTTSPIPLNQTDWSLPLRVPLALPQPSPSLNLNLFKNPIPNNQFDWSLPLRVPHITPDSSRPLNPNLFKNPVPNNQTEWPQSFRVPHITPDGSRPLNPNLFKNPIPFAQFDWSKPIRQLPLPVPIQAYNDALYSVIVVAAPFNQTDWALPQRLKALPLPPDRLNQNLFTNPLPFNQFDWLKPFRVPLALAQPSPPLNINIFTNQFPFGQTDWSKPQQIKITQPRPAEGININLFTNPIPFANLDRTIPLALRGQPDQSQPYNLNLYGVVTVSLPFNQYDWTPARRPLARLGDDPPNFGILVAVAPSAPLEEHSLPFFATPGRLMGM